MVSPRGNSKERPPNSAMDRLKEHLIGSRKLVRSPIRTVVFLAILVFLVEFLIMNVLHRTPRISEPTEALIDSIVLILLLIPGFYFILFRPMLAGIETERVLNSALQTSEEQFRSIYEQSPIAIEVYDSDGLLVQVNQACLDLFGVDQVAEVKGFKLLEDPNVSEDAKKQFQKGEAVQYETAFDFDLIKKLGLYKTSKSGKYFIDVRITPLRAENGNKNGGYLVQVQDITERKQAEKARARLNAQLDSKNKELEQIVYVASHDLRSPLVNIDGYGKELEHAIDDLRSAFDSDKTPTEALETVAPLLAHDIPDALRFIRTSASKMNALLAGLLKLSRSGRAALTIDSLDMNELIAKVVDASEFQIKEAGAELNVTELPPCKGDAVQVNQVFSNLLGNALQYLDPERPGAIRFSGQVEGERSVYCVEDNGIGIAPARRQIIFEIFHRLDPVRSQGEGLGLTIVQQVLDRLSGDIWVESKPGKGSRFYVALPAVHKSQ